MPRDANPSALSPPQAKQVLFKLTVCGLASSAQTIFAFTFLAMVSAVTYSVANVTKRVCIIAVSAVVFQNPISAANAFGIAMAMVRGGAGPSLSALTAVGPPAVVCSRTMPPPPSPPLPPLRTRLFLVWHWPVQQGQAQRKGQGGLQADGAAAGQRRSLPRRGAAASTCRYQGEGGDGLVGKARLDSHRRPHPVHSAPLQPQTWQVL